MANDVTIHIHGDNQAHAALQSAERDMARVVMVNDRANRSMRDATDTYREFERRAAAAGSTVSSNVRRLGDDITRARTEIERLNGEYARTGDDAHLRGITEQHRRLQELTRTLRNIGTDQGIDWSHLMGNAAEAAGEAGAHAASTFTQVFEGGILSAFRSMPPEAQAAIGGSLAAAAAVVGPILVGALDAAILGALGAGGLAAGVALAVRDPAISGAFVDLGSRVLSELEKAAEPFKEPLLAVAREFGAGWSDIEPAVSRIFSSLSGKVAPLGSALVDAVQKMMPGLERAFQGAQPVLDAIIRELPEMGEAIGDFLADLGEVGPEVARALTLVLKFGEAGIEIFGDWLNLMGKLAGVMEPLGRGAAVLLDLAEKAGLFGGAGEEIDGAGTKISGAALKIARGMDEASTSSSDFVDAARAAAEEARTLMDALDELSGKAIDARDAEYAFNEALINARESIAANGATLDEHTEKGQANNDALMQIVESTRQWAQAAYDMTYAEQGQEAATASANAVLEQGREALIKTAMQMGMTRAQAEALADQLLRIPPNINTTVTVNVSQALEAIRAVQAAVNNLKYGMAATYAEYYYSQAAGQKSVGFQRFGGIHHAAKGLVNLGSGAGVFPDGADLINFAEAGTGGEAYIARNAPDAASLAIANTAARWHGGRVVRDGQGGGAGNVININVYPTPLTSPAETGAAVVDAIKAYERGNGKTWRAA